MTKTFSSALKRLAHIFGQLEQWTIIFLLSLLVVFSLLQIVLRNFFSTGLVYADNLLRHGVLWISFLGAARATVEHKHIRIDLLPRLMPVGGRFVAQLICAFFSCLLCLTLFWASWNFVQGERLAGDIAFASIPYWWLELIFPFSFGLMAFRFGFNLISGLLKGPDRIEK
jgi:TRAP-type C4-dicarboxylate transport system permease small subunit